jgi:hypothetical protein
VTRSVVVEDAVVVLPASRCRLILEALERDVRRCRANGREPHPELLADMTSVRQAVVSARTDISRSRADMAPRLAHEFITTQQLADRLDVCAHRARQIARARGIRSVRRNCWRASDVAALTDGCATVV